MSPDFSSSWSEKITETGGGTAEPSTPAEAEAQKSEWRTSAGPGADDDGGAAELCRRILLGVVADERFRGRISAMQSKHSSAK